MSTRKQGKMNKHNWRLLLGILALVWYHNPAAAQTLQWARQFASPPNATFQIAADSSGIYVAGITMVALPGQTKINLIGSDGFLRKYDSAGNVLWTREFAPYNLVLFVYGVAVDSSGVYVVGTTGGSRKVASGESWGHRRLRAKVRLQR
jgi:hypothetical protein